jgi:hypothetical protein
MQYPVFGQTLQNYTDIYWELNYLTDNVMLGLGVSRVNCEKFTKCWTMPEGKIICHKGGYWLVTGYTFREGDKVTLSDIQEDYPANLPLTYHIQNVMAEKEWNINGTYIDTDYNTGAYKEGDWVKFLDKIYVCRKGHTVIDPKNIKKIKPEIIYPVTKGVDEDGNTVAVQSDYWEVGCRVVLVTYKLKNSKREIIWDIDDIPTSALFKATIRRFRPMVDSQGFIFEYEYEPNADSSEAEYLIREVGGNWEGILGTGWNQETDPETVILEGETATETYVEKQRR